MKNPISCESDSCLLGRMNQGNTEIIDVGPGRTGDDQGIDLF